MKRHNAAMHYVHGNAQNTWPQWLFEMKVVPVEAAFRDWHIVQGIVLWAENYPKKRKLNAIGMRCCISGTAFRVAVFGDLDGTDWTVIVGATYAVVGAATSDPDPQFGFGKRDLKLNMAKSDRGARWRAILRTRHPAPADCTVMFSD